MKLLLGILTFLLAETIINGQILHYEWGNTHGSSYSDEGRYVTTDDSGNVYVIGSFQQTVDFDPGSGISNLTAQGYYDIFVQKLDTDGNLIWIRHLKGPSVSYGRSIALDSVGNIYLTGMFTGSVDFDPGPGTAILSGSVISGQYNMCTVKLDLNGNFLWAKKTGSNVSIWVTEIIIDDSSNIYSIGSFLGTVDFNPGSGVSNISSLGSADVFIQKLDSDGNFIWAKRIGGVDAEWARDIAVDGTGNIYACGSFFGLIDFDPGPGISNLTSLGGTDIYVIKFASDGSFVWVKQIGGALPDAANAIAIDRNEDIYVTGEFQGTVDFDPGPNTTVLMATGISDCYVQKLDSAGNFLWVRQMEGVGRSAGRSILANGNIYTVGIFSGTTDFDPGSNTTNLSSVGGNDIFIHKMDPQGNFKWTGSFGGTSDEFIYKITADNSGNIYTVGSHASSILDLDPSAGLSNVNSQGAMDLYIQKINECFPSHANDSITACNSYTWIDGANYSYSNNTAIWTLPGSNGCDSVVSLNLTINEVDTSTTYDSTTIHSNSSGSYQWLDCDNNFAVIPGETNQNFTPIISGNYAVEITENGCSAISACIKICNVDTSVSVAYPIITSNAVNASFRWLDCDNYYALIPGETNQSFTATSNGNYAVEITENGCIDTSACVNILGLGINAATFGKIQIFPNPTSGQISIDLGTLNNVSIKVYNIREQIIFQTDNICSGTYQFDFNASAGLYFIDINSEGISKRYKLIKE